MHLFVFWNHRLFTERKFMRNYSRLDTALRIQKAFSDHKINTVLLEHYKDETTVTAVLNEVIKVVKKNTVLHDDNPISTLIQYRIALGDNLWSFIGSNSALPILMGAWEQVERQKNLAIMYHEFVKILPEDHKLEDREIYHAMDIF